VFIDISKAFNKVWHSNRMYKLQSWTHQNTYLILLILFYQTENQYFSTNSQYNISELQSIFAGVPQGSKLGPILFNIYITDIPHSPHTNIALYADDTTIYKKKSCFK